ncbi:MAG TPA: metallophosphoesterase, partial [Myxococcaceae bacterium]|nr:metallophosphoesterase [Myxococcaceae bacterium]
MLIRFAIFFAVMTALVAVTHVYLYRRLVRDTLTHKRARTLGLVAVVTLALLMIGGRFLARYWPNELTKFLGDIGFVWMGVALFLVLALLAVGGITRGANWVTRILGRNAHRPAGAVDPERRVFLARSVAGGAAVLAGGATSFGVWRAYHPPEITELSVRLPRLAGALDGLSIVQLTDIHVGNMVERRFLDELVQRTNALQPDVVAITGDLVDGDVATLGSSVAALANLRSRYGTFFVTGNHEYYSGEREWTAFLDRLGVHVLRNRHVRIGDDSASLDLIGVDDWGARRSGGGYDLDAALAGRESDRAAVLLAHQPANFREAASRGIGLQLSGHTHGGQIFPFTLAVSLAWEFAAGLYRA